MPLEQWIYFLNTGRVPESADAPGLPEVRRQLKLDTMTREELRSYYRHLDNAVILKDNIETGREEGRREGKREGRLEGIKEGLEKGLEQGRIEEKLNVARNLKMLNVPADQIAEATGLSRAEVEAL